MMSLQSRELRTANGHQQQPLRAYPANSPRAAARLIALALLADGELADSEITALAQSGVFAKIGIRRPDFVEVFNDLCLDLGHLSPSQGNYHLPPAMVNQMLTEISLADTRRTVHQLIEMLVHSDGDFSLTERQLLEQICAAWPVTQNGSADRTIGLRNPPPSRQDLS